MSDKNPILYKLHDTLTGDVVYIKAYNRAGARNFHVANRFTVEPLTVSEALKISASDVVDGTVDLKQQKLDV